MPLSITVNKFQRLGKVGTWALKAWKDFLGWTENKGRKPALKKQHTIIYIKLKMRLKLLNASPNIILFTK